VTPDAAEETGPARRGLARRLADDVRQRTGLPCSTEVQAGWLGVQCPDVRSAVWMMRALVASNVLSRREDAMLFVPVNPSVDPRGDIVAAAVAQVYAEAQSRGVSGC
jgi:sirohydrochlorin cobaltochelatase